MAEFRSSILMRGTASVRPTRAACSSGEAAQAEWKNPGVDDRLIEAPGLLERIVSRRTKRQQLDTLLPWKWDWLKLARITDAAKEVFQGPKTDTGSAPVTLTTLARLANGLRF